MLFWLNVRFVPEADVYENGSGLRAAMFLQFDIGIVNLFFITPAELHVKFRRATIFIGFQPGNLMMFE